MSVHVYVCVHLCTKCHDLVVEENKCHRQKLHSYISSGTAKCSERVEGASSSKRWEDESCDQGEKPDYKNEILV